jgi:predicted NUDIX family phosphoesterase
MIQVVDALYGDYFDEGYTSVKWDDRDINDLLRHRVSKLRSSVENDFNYRQLVVYVTVVNRDREILIYPRSGSEERLHNMYSIGIGGHVDAQDGVDAHMNLYYDGCITDTLVREVKEEIGVNTRPEHYLFGGIIKLSKTDVDRVHIGFHFLLFVDNAAVSREIKEFEYVPPSNLSQYKLETWSLCVVDSGILDKLANIKLNE